MAEDLSLDTAQLGRPETYRLLTSLVVPRPIAWVSSLAADGARNLAPHSYFNACSAAPPIVHFTSSGRKDTLRNVEATREFVVNIVGADLIGAMNLTATNFPSDEDEFTWAGLEAAPSVVVAPPRVAAAPAALECRLRQTLTMGDGTVVFGEVVHVHVAAAVLRDGKVDPRLLRPVARLSGASYAIVTDVFELARPRWDAEAGRPRA